MTLSAVKKGKWLDTKKWKIDVAKRCGLSLLGKMGPELPNGQTLNYNIFFELPLLICASLLKKEEAILVAQTVL